MVFVKRTTDRPRTDLLNRRSDNNAPSLVVKKKCLPIKRTSTSTSTTCATTTESSASSSSVVRRGFRAPKILCVQRAAFFSGLSVENRLAKPFQRPMIKRRAYGTAQETALVQSSLGQRRRFDGMQRLLQRAGLPLHAKPCCDRTKSNDNAGDTDRSSDDDDDESEDEKEETPFEPLWLWKSPHEGGEPKGLPSRSVVEERPDEYGILERVTVIRPAPCEFYAKHNVQCPPIIAKKLRPHQRDGVQFMYECVMGLKEYHGNGVILADDMGLGKTLQSVALIYTLLKTGITCDNKPTAKRVIVVCPCSLVKNWEHEFVKWLGEGTVKVAALAEADRSKIEREISSFVHTNVINVLIASYECIRTHYKLLLKSAQCCDLLVCDEAHRLKNSENQTAKALNALPVKRRVLLTGTPMQNDLQEFYAMVDFTNPGILGTPDDFRRKMLFPILRGREPDATEAQKAKMLQIQNDMSTTVNDFILRRVNTLNAQHLPPKLVQVVCCNLTEIQSNMYQHLVTSKDMQHVLDGKQVNCLASIQMLMKLCNHPTLVADEDPTTGRNNKLAVLPPPPRRAAASKQIKYTDEDTKESTAAPGADGIAKFLPYVPGEGSRGRGDFAPVHPEWSGKMFVLYRLMKEMRRPGNGNDKIVIVSNYTQTLDLIGRMCRENSWGFCRLDGSIGMKKRQRMVDDFNDPSSSLIAFLLSSKAGGCGLNLIGGNRLVLFDPDWNPAVDKQAAARCWRDGQKKRCFTYRFLATGTVEEKIFQRQLSKEGLQSVVDDKEQVNALSTKDLRNLFKLRTGTPSDTHDKLKCERCQIIHDNAEMEAQRVLPKKLAACRELLEALAGHEDGQPFLQPLDPTVHGTTKESYENLVKQPMDLGTIRTKLDLPPGNSSAYKTVSGFSKDVNRVFSNVLKVWEASDDIVLAARRLQSYWVEQWTELVPRLMTLKADEDDEATHKAAGDGDDAADVLEACANIHNERGDDYQEQIGMPDEENMRLWSHHNTTDTVDDPVFRAAMRGCDAVSFVFGLEVTWSLIQQRQLEEEERIALQELNCMREGEGEAEDAASAAEECTSEEVAKAGDKGREEYHDIDTAKSPPSDSGAVAAAENNIESPSGVDNHKSMDADKMLIAENSPEASTVLSGASADEASVSSSKPMSSIRDKENSPTQPTSNVDRWACSSCTLMNPQSSSNCGACGKGKPRKKRSIGDLST